MPSSPLDVQLIVPEDDGTVQLTVVEQYQVTLEVSQSYGVDVYTLEAPGAQIVINNQNGGGALADLSDTQIDPLTVQDQQPLVYSSSIQKWIPGTPASASITPGEISYTINTLSAGGVQDFGIELGSIFQLLSFTSSNPVWIRLYGTASARESDTRSTPGGTPPLSGTDFYVEMVTVGQYQTIRLSPIPTIQAWYGTTFARVVNMGNTATAFNFTFKNLPFAPSPSKLDLSCLLQPAAAPNTALNFNGEFYATAVGPAYGSANEYWFLNTLGGSEVVNFVNNSYEVPLANELIFALGYIFTPDPLNPALSSSSQLSAMSGLQGVIPELTLEFIFRGEEENIFVGVLQLGDWVLRLEGQGLGWSVSDSSPPSPQNTIELSPASYQSFTHFAAVYYEDQLSLFVNGIKIGSTAGSIPAPVVSPNDSSLGKLIAGLVLPPPADGTVVPSAIKGFRFTSRALYFENFSPPSSISSLIPEFT